MYDRKTSIRLTNTIFVAQSFLTASQIAIFTLLAIVAVDLSGRESLTGIPSTVLTLTKAAAAIPIGYLMGRMGRRFGLTISYGLSSIGAILGVIAIIQGWFWMLLISSAVIGAGRAGGDLSRFAAGDMFPESERGQMIGRVVFAGTAGAIFGPLLVVPGGIVATNLGLNANIGPWLLGVVFYGLATAIVFFLLRPDPMDIARTIADGEKRKQKRDRDDDIRSIRTLLRLPQVQLAILSMLISQVVMVALMTITPLHMAHHDYGNGHISLVISAHTLGMFGLSPLTGRLIDRYGRISMLIAGAVILIISAVLAPLSTGMPILIISLFLLGLGWNFGYIAGSSLLADVLKGEERTRMQGFNDMLVAFAAGMGSGSSGPIFGMSGFLGVAVGGLLLSLLFLWVIYLLSPRQPVFDPAN